MHLKIDEQVFDLFPGLSIVLAAAVDIDNLPNPDASSYLDAAWDRAHRLREAYPNAQSHPYVQAWREAFRSMGVPPRDFPSSIEALLRRAFKGGEPPRINPLVDFYNAVSLNNVVPAGGFDLAPMDARFELRMTTDADLFTPLDGGDRIAVEPGEVAYTAGNTVLTRHFVWRQSKEGLIAEGTRDIVLLAEILGDVGDEVAEAVEMQFAGGLRDVFGVEPRLAIVGKGDGDISI